jgi:hypothetical protein
MDGTVLRGKGRQEIPAGQRLVLDVPAAPAWAIPMRAGPRPWRQTWPKALCHRRLRGRSTGVLTANPHPGYAPG